jgi:glycosyltransferase involved in cell wall biosynthesis
MSYSVLILTHNEEINIRRCLDSLTDCDDVVVVDSHSQDETAAIIRESPARLFFRDFDSFAGQRNWAIDHVEFKHRWVLHLDADECMTPGLHAELCDVVSRDQKSAYYIANKIIFLNRWVRHASMYPFYQARLLRLGESRFEQIGHGQHLAFATRGTGQLSESYLHYNFSKGISDWLRRHNKYSSDEAERIVKGSSLGGGTLISCVFGNHGDEKQQALKLIADRIPCRPLIRFVYLYFWKRAFMDGMPGFHYSVLVAFYDYLIRVKAKEIRIAESSRTFVP